MSPSKKEELLPCPFCHAQPYWRDGFAYHPFSNGSRQNACPLEDEFYAAEHWNRRALPDREALVAVINGWEDWHPDAVHLADRILALLEGK